MTNEQLLAYSFFCVIAGVSLWAATRKSPFAPIAAAIAGWAIGFLALVLVHGHFQ